jgi:hypothetical protein
VGALALPASLACPPAAAASRFTIMLELPP